MNENCPPALTEPESNAFPFDVVVCATESVFCQVTVEPTVMLRLSGAYARLPSDSAPTGMTTDDDSPPCVGVGEGDADGEEGDEVPPQPIAAA